MLSKVASCATVRAAGPEGSAYVAIPAPTPIKASTTSISINVTPESRLRISAIVGLKGAERYIGVYAVAAGLPVRAQTYQIKPPRITG